MAIKPITITLVSFSSFGAVVAGSIYAINSSGQYGENTVGRRLEKTGFILDKNKEGCKEKLFRQYTNWNYKNAFSCINTTFQQRAEMMNIGVLKNGKGKSEEWERWWSERKNKIKAVFPNIAGDWWYEAKNDLIRECEEKGKTFVSEKARKEWKKYLTACFEGKEFALKVASVKDFLPQEPEK